VTYATKTASDRLNELVADHLTFHYPNSVNGIEDISLKIKRGSLTVITGRIGSGKTTLLRTLLGLLPADSGEIRWNGQVITDAGNFFIPPRCAYTAQVPRLFSNSLRNNILLGMNKSDDEIYKATKLAVMDRDLESSMTISKRWSAHAASNSLADKPNAPPPPACSSANRNSSSSTTSPARWMSKPKATLGTHL
jgi:ABC-type multidrug transport system fused ATPase/permease subunit